MRTDNGEVDPQFAGTGLSIAIIGAGFSGLGLGIRLKQAGYENFTIYEQADGVGGTWRANTYPGCGCDVPSHLYSFSFAPKADWSSIYPGQAEILEYLESLVSKFGLEPHIRFRTEIKRCSFDEAHSRWRLVAENGEDSFADILVGATGPLSKPDDKKFEGMESFKGRIFHSAEWDHAVDLSGKTVALIGTGASAIQIAPAILPRTKRLFLFQRTPPWIFPRLDRAYSSDERRRFARQPWLRRLYRTAIYWKLESRAMSFLGSERIRKIGVRWAKQFIADSIPNPALRQKVTPDYELGCKRVLISDDYYSALNDSKLELVDEAVARFDTHGVMTRSGRHVPVDVAILATGFRATEFVSPLIVEGRDGADLSTLWRKAAESYLGTTVHHFPNLFTLVGPNTGLGHNSIIFMLEAQIHYVMQCIRRMGAGEFKRFEVLPRVQEGFVERIQADMTKTVWLSGCKSWYQSDDGRVFTLWPGFTWQYWLRTRRFRDGDYKLD